MVRPRSLTMTMPVGADAEDTATETLPLRTAETFHAALVTDAARMASGTCVPGVCVPGVSVPGVCVPGVSVPGVCVPGVSVPGVGDGTVTGAVAVQAWLAGTSSTLPAASV